MSENVFEPPPGPAGAGPSSPPSAPPSLSASPVPPPAMSGYSASPDALSESDARMWSMLAYLGTLLLGFIAPLVVWLALGNRSDFVKRNAVECLNFQIACLIAWIVSAVLALVLIGFLLMPLIAIYSLVISIVGAVKTYGGEEFRIPLNIRFIKG